MKQNLILVVILLASILMVNAIPHQFNKRATSFITCPNKVYPNTITVSIQPDPPVPGQVSTFAVGGTFAIDAGSRLIVVPSDSDGNPMDPLIADICTTGGITCPTNTTTPFSITQSFTMPAKFSFITVTIVDATTNILACSISKVGTATSASIRIEPLISVTTFFLLFLSNYNFGLI
jgi:hypothetical protein